MVFSSVFDNSLTGPLRAVAKHRPCGQVLSTVVKVQHDLDKLYKMR